MAEVYTIGVYRHDRISPLGFAEAKPLRYTGAPER